MGFKQNFNNDEESTEENNSEANRKQKSNSMILSSLALVTQLGFIIGIATTGGVFLGRFIDTKMNTAGIFVIIGAVLGLTAGLLSGYRLIRRALK